MQTVSNQRKILGSWKEIASYLGKGVRTVQRWEHQFGLPVRRPNVTAKGVVCASPEELDSWFKMYWGRRTAKSSSSDGTARKAVRASIQASAELHHANQQLMAELMRSVRGVAKECEALAGYSTPSPKQDEKGRPAQKPVG